MKIIELNKGLGVKAWLTIMLIVAALAIAVFAPGGITAASVTAGYLVYFVGGNALNARRAGGLCLSAIPLWEEERANWGFTHKAVLTYADFTTAAASQAFTLLTLVAGQFVFRTAHKLITDFASANGTALGVTFGNGSSATAYGASKELQGTEVDFYTTITIVPAAGLADQVGETEALKATFTSSGGTTPLVTEYTAGEVHLYFAIVDLNKI